MKDIHISQARRIMQLPSAFSLTFLTKDGSEVRMAQAVSLKWDMRTGTRTIKSIKSGEIRRIRDSLILEINDIPVFI